MLDCLLHRHSQIFSIYAIFLREYDIQCVISAFGRIRLRKFSSIFVTYAILDSWDHCASYFNNILENEAHLIALQESILIEVKLFEYKADFVIHIPLTIQEPKREYIIHI